MFERLSSTFNIWTNKFFRLRLLGLTDPEVVGLLEQYDKDSKALVNEAIKLSWFMRGGLSYAEALDLSPDERKIISELIKDNLETTKKSGLPFF